MNSNTLALGIPDFPDLSLTQGNTYLHLGVNGNSLSGPVTWSGRPTCCRVSLPSSSMQGGLAQAGWTFAPGWQVPFINAGNNLGVWNIWLLDDGFYGKMSLLF
ncbi:MAG: hypothetical protein ACKO5F_00185 [Synechococcus sp.]